MNDALNNILNDMSKNLNNILNDKDVEEEKQEQIEKLSSVKILLIGYGYWGKIWYKTIQQSPYELVAVVDSIFGDGKELISETVNAYNKISDVKEEYTHAIIATPAETHLSIYKTLKEKFGLADENILVEKPVGVSSEEAWKMKNCFHGFVWLYDESYTILKERKNSLGKLLRYDSLRASMGPRIRTDISILEDYLFHDLYMFFDIFSDESSPSVAHVQWEKYFKDPIEKSGISIELESIFNTMSISMRSSWWHPNKERKIILIGSGGTLIWENDTIFIDRTGYEQRDKDFIDKHGNKGYELKSFPRLEIKSENDAGKSNLEKQLDNFINSSKSNTTDLLIKTWSLIDKIYLLGE